MRHAMALTDGLEFVRGDVVAIVTRSGSDEEALEVLCESLRDETVLTGASSFQLLPRDTDPGVQPTVTIVTAWERDPGLHIHLWEHYRGFTAPERLG